MNSFPEKHYNVIVLLSALLFLAINESVLVDLYHKWYATELNGPYAHGLLVAIVVIYIVLKKVLGLREVLKPEPSILGVCLLFGSQLFMLLAELGDVNFAQYMAVISTLICIVWAAYSYRIAKQFIVPGLLMLLTIPVWEWIEIPLQKVSIITTNLVLAATGIPYYLDGSYFHFASGVIQIAPGCAGMQQMLVSMIIGLIFSIQFRLRFRETVKTLLYLAIAAIIINTLRIIIVMIVGYYTKMESSLVTKHILLGWFVYGIGIFAFLYFYSGRKFPHANGDFKINADKRNLGLLGRHLRLCLIFLIVVISFPLVAYQFIAFKVNEHESHQVYLRVNDARWYRKSQAVNINWHPDYPNADSKFSATFSENGNNVYIYINAYDHIKNGIEPVNMDNTAYNSSNWRLHGRTLAVVQTSDDRTVHVYLDEVDSSAGQQLLIMHFYLINGKVSVNLTKTKLYIILGLLQGHYDIKQVSLASLIRPGEPVNVVANRLKTFVKSMHLK